MKKSLVFVLLVVAAMLAFNAVAYAVTHNFDGWFSIDVPAGWTVEGSGADMYVRVASLDGSESITFEYASAEGMGSREFAEYTLGILGGSGSVTETNYGSFGFTLPNGSNVRALMTGCVGVVMKSVRGFDNLQGIIETFVGF